MLFNSWLFILFFLIVLALYWILPHRRQNILIVVVSYIFYGFWDWRFLGLLLFSTVLDFAIAQGIQRASERRFKKRLLLLSIVGNLGLLGAFKYFDFFVDSATELLSSLGLEAHPPLLNVILPVGISFYTFQTMAYTIDVYRNEQKAVTNLISYAMYVAYFPQLVAGPIERARRLIPQIEAPRHMTPEKWNSATQLILWGFVKKIAIADTIAPFANKAFADPAAHDGLFLWLALYCFAIQIYCDFSGYSDIARGTSRMMGIELMENFRAPYLSSNITVYWQRWHISLSTWLRDYLYIPLGGNRYGKVRQYRNLMIAMLLGGLWHGAGWTYILWGGLNGFYLAVHRLCTDTFSTTKNIKSQENRSGLLRRMLGVIVIFHLACFSYIPFRSPDLSTMSVYFKTITSPAQWHGLEAIKSTGIIENLAVYGLTIFVLDLMLRSSPSDVPFDKSSPRWVRGLAYGFGLVLLAYVRGGSNETFFYFQF